MRQVLLCTVIICLLLGTLCGCPHDVSQSLKKGIEHKEAGDGTQGEQVQNEPETSEVLPPEEQPPAVEPPDEVLPPEEVPPPPLPPQPPETPELPPPSEVPPEELPPPEEPPPPPEAPQPPLPPEPLQTPEPPPPPPIEPPVVPPPPEPPEVIIPPPPPQPPEPPEVELSETLLLVINEVRPDYSTNLKYAEYIEFKVKGGGNMKGLQVHIMNEARNPFIYTFPAIDVAEGEYITLHLRTFENNCINELGGNLSLSGGIESCPTARDLWVSGSEKLLHKTDIIIVQDINGVIHDALCLNETPGKPWGKNQAHFSAILEDLNNKMAWKSPDGVDTSAASIYKSVNRRESVKNTHSVNDWYLTVNTSPGLPNK